MGTGAVISIDYANAFGIIGAFSSNGNDVFSGIIEPIRKAKISGNMIMSKLQEISAKIDVDSTISQLYSQDDGERGIEIEISENAKAANKEEQVIYGALTNVESKLLEFGSTVIAVDNKAATFIKERKLEFNRRYPHLESESEYRQRMDERSFGEKVGDFCYGYVLGFGLIDGYDSLVNGRERIDARNEAIKKKIGEFATKTCEWVQKNEAFITAGLVILASVLCTAAFGPGATFVIFSLLSLYYAVLDKIIAINNDGQGTVQTMEATGHHHWAQIENGVNWGLQISMVISGFMLWGTKSGALYKNGGVMLEKYFPSSMLKDYSLFKSKGGPIQTMLNGAILGGGYNYVVDRWAYITNFIFSKKAHNNIGNYFNEALTDTTEDVLAGAVIGAAISGLSYGVVKIKDTLKFKSIINSGLYKTEQGNELNHYVEQRARSIYEHAASEQYYTHNPAYVPKGKVPKGNSGRFDLIVYLKGKYLLFETKLTEEAPHTTYQIITGIEKGALNNNVYIRDVTTTTAWLRNVSFSEGSTVAHIYGKKITHILGTRKIGNEATHFLSELLKKYVLDKLI